MIKSDKPAAIPSNSKSTIVPQPLKVEPVKEKPNTVVELADIIKPCASASPPAALKIEAPSTSN